MACTIVITGASAGIGAACAARFLDEGWNVALLARRAAPLQDLAAGHSGRALALPCDVADEHAVAAAFAATVARFGRIDVLFNNAGIFPPTAPIDEVPVAAWRQAVDVNLTGMFLCARAAFGQMRRQSPQGGRIINNGSISAHSPRPGSVCYTATKHAVTGLTRTLELDGRAFDITCGQVDIGNVRTDIAAKFEAGVPQADGSIRPEPVMEMAPVIDAVWLMANLPAEANVPFMTVMASKMPFIGRG